MVKVTVLLITDVKKIKIKSLGIPGVLDVKFDYEEPKAGEKAMEYSGPEAEGIKNLEVLSKVRGKE